MALDVDDAVVEPYWCPYILTQMECMFALLWVKPCDRCLQAQRNYYLEEILRELRALRATRV
jgi:hypothetical protein